MHGLGLEVTDPDDFAQQLSERMDNMRTDPESYPEEPADVNSIAHKAWVAQMAAINAKEATADQVQATSDAANNQCKPPYEQFFDQAYDAAFPAN